VPTMISGGYGSNRHQFSITSGYEFFRQYFIFHA
jgi:hypothetical protein